MLRFLVEGQFAFTDFSATYSVSDVRITNGIEVYDGLNEYNIGSYMNPDYNNVIANFVIPEDASVGVYDVEVFDFYTQSWVVLEDGFTIDNYSLLTNIEPNVANQSSQVDIILTFSDNINNTYNSGYFLEAQITLKFIQITFLNKI